MNFPTVNWRGITVATIVLVGLIDVVPDRALAVTRDYTLDMTQSHVAISGTVQATVSGIPLTSTINSQGTGTQGGNSLFTRYTGTIKTDRDDSLISFLSGSAIDANVNGSWAPAADALSNTPAPADYGGRSTFILVVANFAGRDFVGGLTSSALAVDGSSQFPLSSTTLTFSNGSIAYRAEGVTFGTQSVVGEGGLLSGIGTLGTLSQSGSVYETLLIPINSTFQVIDPMNPTTIINLTLSGQLFGQYLIPSSNGDYNQNGTVDAGDYAVWRNMLDQTGVGLAADGNGDNQITTADYDVWRSKFGQTVGSGAGLSSDSAVPEPSALLLLAAASLLATARGRGRDCYRAEAIPCRSCGRLCRVFETHDE
jgi:hypothetical protein